MEFCGAGAAGGSGERSCCVGKRPLGGLLGKEQLMALLTKFLPLMEAQWSSSSSANFSGILLILKARMRVSC